MGGPRAALAWLLAADLVFYGWWNPRYVPLLAGLGRRSTSSSASASCRLAQAGRHDAAARLADRRRRRSTSRLLGWFKYADFLLHLAAPGAPSLGIVLPLAISFFTFQQIMFLVDSARGSRPATGALPYAAFVCFFPHLIAGPIVRPTDIMPQLQAPRPGAAASPRTWRRG